MNASRRVLGVAARRLADRWRAPAPRDVLLLAAAPLGILVLLLLAITDYRRQRVLAAPERASLESLFRARVAVGRHLVGAIPPPAGGEGSGRLALSLPEGRWPALALHGARGPQPSQPILSACGTPTHPASAAGEGHPVAAGQEEANDLGPATGVDARDLPRETPHAVLDHQRPLERHLAARLADAMGVMTPTSELVALYVSGRYYGLARVTERLDAAFLKGHGRLPGHLLASKANRPGAPPVEPFATVAQWTRSAPDPAGPGQSSRRLEELLEGTHGASLGDHLRLLATVDQAAVVRYLAALLLLGDVDQGREQHWYENPGTGRLVPILAEPAIHPVDSGLTAPDQLMEALLRDPHLVAAVLETLAQELDSEHWLARAAGLVEQVRRDHGERLAYQASRADEGEPSEALGALLATLAHNAARVRSWLAAAAVRLDIGSVGDSAMVLDLESGGYAGAELTGLRVAGSLASGELWADSNQDGVLDPGDRLVQGRWTTQADSTRFEPVSPVRLLSAWTRGSALFVPAPLHYRLFLRVPDPTLAVSVELRNVHTGQPVTAEDWPHGERVDASAGWHPWRFPRQGGTVITWRDAVDVPATFTLDQGDTLIVEAGTVVRLAPEASIIARGPVFVRGDETAHVRFEAAEPGRPWGSFALIGGGASGSAIEWASFSGGGGSRKEGIALAAMVSVHDADAVRFEDVELGNDRRGEASLRALHSDVTLLRPSFVETHAVALRLDYSTGAILDARFDLAGTDAIELTGSSPIIAGTRIIGAADRGIAAGERSHPVIFNSVVAGARVGLDVRDESEPVLLNSILVGNGTGIRSHRRNWDFNAGGWAKVVNSAIERNGVDAETDPASRLTVEQSLIGSERPDGTRETTPWVSGGELDWLYRRYGWSVTRAESGLLPSWDTVPPVEPRLRGELRTLLGNSLEPWRPASDGTRIHRGDRVMAASLGPEPGGVYLPVDWSLPSRDSTYVLVVEVAARNTLAAALVAEGAGTSVFRGFSGTLDPSHFRYVTLELPAGRYTRITLAATPWGEEAQLELHGYTLYALPKGPAGPTLWRGNRPRPASRATFTVPR